MKKQNKITGRAILWLLCMCCALLATQPAAWAQQSGGNTSGNTPSTGQDGYSIDGETDPADLKKDYLYTRTLPDGAKDVYWHVEGAANIEGAPAGKFPDGSLLADKYPTLLIQWSTDSLQAAVNGKRSTSPFVLQLRRFNPATKAADTLANLAIMSWPFTCTGHIEYYGPSTALNGSGSTANQTLCPTPPVGQFGTYPLYRYNFNTPDCDYFIWTIKYLTATGQYYNEQWLAGPNRTAADFPLFTQVPPHSYPTYYDAQGNPVSPRLMPPAMQPYNYTPAPGPTPGQNALAGQNVLQVVVECTGYRSILCNIDDRTYVFYEGVLGDPGDVTVTSAPSPYCRNQSVTFATGGSAVTGGTTTYNWTVRTSSGAVFTSGTGPNITVNLANIPASMSNITATVQAHNSSSCGNTSSVTKSLTIPLATSSASPQNLQLNGSCPSTTAKTLSIDPIPGSSTVLYRWFISGPNTANAYLLDNSNNPTQDKNFSSGITAQLVTPNAPGASSGSVTVNVEAKIAECGGPSTALTRTFQIGDIIATCPTISVERSPCFSNVATLSFGGGTPGVSYYIARQPYNITSSTATATINNGSSPTSITRPVTLTSGRFEFDVDLFITSPCPPTSGPGSSGFTTCTVQHVFVQKFIQGNLCRGANGGSSSASASELETLLYPNPAIGQVNVQPEVPTNYQWVKVRNIQGQLLLDQQSSSAAGITSFDVHTLPPGLYEVQLFDGERLTSQRLVKE